MEKNIIRHSVVFSLKHDVGTPKAMSFLMDGQKILTGIPSVMHFEVLKQVSPKSNYEYGFSMEFASQEGYLAYNNHPDHIAFVQQRWQKEVTKFMELDFIAF